MKKIINICNDIKNYGGKCYFVGGYVRDKLINNIEVDDIDIEVYHISFNNLKKIIAKYGKCEVFEKFSVIRFENTEFALPRTESKCGNSHVDFNIFIDSNLNMETALSRRDFTMNAILVDVFTHEVFDPYHGLIDIQNQVIRHVSHQYIEDPLRLLRAIRFSSYLGYNIDDTTIEICHKMINTLDYISNERFEKEFNQFLEGEYISFAIKYYNLFLSNYLHTSKIEKFEIKCTNKYIIKLLFYYNFKNDNIEKLLSKTMLSKQMQKKISFMRQYSITKANLYYYIEEFNDSDLVCLYNEVLNIDLTTILYEYHDFCRQYNGHYYKNQGLVSHEISAKLLIDRKQKLNELLNKSTQKI